MKRTDVSLSLNMTKKFDNDMIILHQDISDKYLKLLIKQKAICFGGNRKLKIYGLLQCKTGERMKRDNRVFFSSAAEAISNHYRPCGNCMRAAYKLWKMG